MYSSADILQMIEEKISSLKFSTPPASLFAPVTYTLSLGGKRLRPSLMLMSCNLYRDDLESYVTPAVGLEVFHNFTLLHDDLMDKADMRRGKATVHKLWNANTAVLSGDAMMIYAYQLVGETELDALKPVLDLFTQTALEICGGQQFDMEFETRSDVTEDEYMEMIRLKTAVLLACALKMGAIVGKASSDDAEHLYQAGINAGLAFQLQDDLLDVYGDSSVFGKNIGGDILCDKKTFLLIKALQLSSPIQRDELFSWIGRSADNPIEKIEAVTDIYNELHLKELSETKIEDYYNRAMNHIEVLSVKKERLQILKDFCTGLMNRQS